MTPLMFSDNNASPPGDKNSSDEGSHKKEDEAQQRQRERLSIAGSVLDILKSIFG